MNWYVWPAILGIGFGAFGVWWEMHRQEPSIEEQQQERRLKAFYNNECFSVLMHTQGFIAAEAGQILDKRYTYLPRVLRLVKIDAASYTNSFALISEMQRARNLMAQRAFKWRKKHLKQEMSNEDIQNIKPLSIGELDDMAAALTGPFPEYREQYHAPRKVRKH